MLPIRTSFLILLIWLTSASAALSDVIKPALAQINVQADGKVKIEIRASIEAMLLGINSQYTNTTESPQAEQYDGLRALSPTELKPHFDAFENQFLNRIWLKADSQVLPLILTKVSIPEAGYTQVPRISTLDLTTQLPADTQQLQWYYPAAFSDNAVRVKQIDLQNEQWHWGQWQWLRADQASQPVPLNLLNTNTALANHSGLSTVVEHIKIGFTHIVPKGLDHLLFIFGLFLFSPRWRPLLWQVSAFTLAHTITLGLASVGWVDMPARITEPLIALSIAYIGFKNWLRPRLGKSRLLLIFLFGLLHGLGFAGVLLQFELASAPFLITLLSFNVGVELAQLAVLLLAYLCCRGLSETVFHRWLRQPLSLVIALIGLLWFIQRIT